LIINDDDKALKLLVLNNLMSNLLEIDDDDDNLYHELYVESDSILSKMKTCDNRSQVFMVDYLIRQKRFDDCKYVVDQIANSFNEYTSTFSRIETFISYEKLYIAQENYVEAEKWALKIKDIAYQKRITLSMLSSDIGLGHIYYSWKKWDLAIVKYKEALARCIQCKLRKEEADVLTILGYSYFNKREFEDAYIVGKKAEKIYRELGFIVKAMKTAEKLSDLSSFLPK